MMDWKAARPDVERLFEKLPAISKMYPVALLGRGGASMGLANEKVTRENIHGFGKSQRLT